MTTYYQDEHVAVHHGDCLEVLATLPDASVDAVVTDPPYGLRFMGRSWDGADIEAATATRRGQAPMPDDGRSGTNGGYRSASTEAGRYDLSANAAFGQWCEAWATECLRVLKPGGHMLAFGGSRTWHRLASAVEDAGFELRDSIAWLYGSGFPKSLDVSKAIDKAVGATGTYGEPKSAAHAGWIDRGRMRGGDGEEGWQRPWMQDADALSNAARKYEPGSPAAEQWQGWGTALKPAFEPIVVGRKPLAGGTVAANVLEHGTGALNIDACRTPTNDKLGGGHSSAGQQMSDGWKRPRMDDPEKVAANAARSRDSVAKSEELGRWPANVLLDESQAAALDEQSGVSVSRPAEGVVRHGRSGGIMGKEGALRDGRPEGHADSGGASRFFPTFRYEAKAPSSERPRVDGIAHPTVKPLALMQWLVRLVTPPGGVVLEPFAGSGATAEACVTEGFRCIAIEREADYLPLIRQRLDKPIQISLFGETA